MKISNSTFIISPEFIPDAELGKEYYVELKCDSQSPVEWNNLTPLPQGFILESTGEMSAKLYSKKCEYPFLDSIIIIATNKEGEISIISY